jgi:hypothetical protein
MSVMRVYRAIVPGDVFGKFTVLMLLTERDPSNRALALVQCSCGSPAKKVRCWSLTAGGTLSCGCGRLPLPWEDQNISDGCHSLTYCNFEQMLSRCECPSNTSYHRYGALGFTVSAELHSYEVFLAYMGPRPFLNASIDRINPLGNYERGNLRWADSTIQNRNKQNNVRLTFDGRTQVLSVWAEETGLNAQTLRNRIKRLGWTVERALTTPVAGRK